MESMVTKYCKCNSCQLTVWLKWQILSCIYLSHNKNFPSHHNVRWRKGRTYLQLSSTRLFSEDSIGVNRDSVKMSHTSKCGQKGTIPLKAYPIKVTRETKGLFRLLTWNIIFPDLRYLRHLALYLGPSIHPISSTTLGSQAFELWITLHLVP